MESTKNNDAKKNAIRAQKPLRVNTKITQLINHESATGNNSIPSSISPTFRRTILPNQRQSWVFNKPPPIPETPSVVLPTPILDKNGLSARSRLSIIMQKGPGDKRISNGNSEVPKSLEELFRRPDNSNEVDNNNNQFSDGYRSVEPISILKRPLSHASTSTTQDSDYDTLSDSIYTSNRDSITTDSTSTLSSSPIQNDHIISEQINVSRHISFQPLSLIKEDNNRRPHRYSIPPSSSGSPNNIKNSRNTVLTSRRASVPLYTSLENVSENPFSDGSENMPLTPITPFTVFEEDEYEEYEANYGGDEPKKEEQMQQSKNSDPNSNHPRRDSSYCTDENDALNLLLLRSSISSAKSASMLNAQLKSRGSVRLRMNLMMQKRHNIAWEILTTERHYVDCLLLIQRLFLKPLLQSLSTANPILTKKSINKIFANLLDLVSLNTELLRRLEDRIMGGSQESTIDDDITWNPEIGCVGDIFLDMGPFFKMYSLYVKNFNSALAAIDVQLRENPTFSSFLRDVIKTGQCKGLTLQAYLIMPVQRIPRYKMLLEDLLKKTDENHLDYLNLKKAYQVIEHVATFVNETIRQHEMFITMLEIQKSLTGFDEVLLVPARTFIKRGTIKKICRRNHQDREFFLFSDILIYASPGIIENLYTFHRKIDLEDVTVISLEDTATMKHSFQIMSPKKSFTLYTDTLKEKEAWINAIRETKNEYLCAKRTLKIAEDNISMDRKDTFKRKRLVENYHAPVWVPDTSADRCMNCLDEFTIFRRKHHCRACGKIICHACSTRNFVIPGSSEQEDQIVRACDPCFFTMFPDAIRDEDIAPGVQVWNHKSSSLSANNSENKENDSISSKRSIEDSSFSSSSLVPNVRDLNLFTMRLWQSNASYVKWILVYSDGGMFALDAKKLKPIDLTLLPEKFFLELLAEQTQHQQEYSNPRDSLANCSIRLCDVCFLGIEPNRVIVNEEGGGWM
ncbi:9699_t:CDS:10, partial [Ambispora leptoticha]